MNNILTYSEYRKQVRLYEEQLVAMQIMKPVEEGLLSGVRKKINAKASIFVREALAEEIEMGKQLNEAIQDAVKDLKEYIDKVQQAVDDSNPEKTELMKKLEKIFEDIRKASFELLEILSGVEINFSDYVANATMAVFVNFGMLFIPTRSVFLLKKSYKYFIGLIKNTIRRDMLMLMLNFDQFENTVLIQSLEDDEQTKWNDEMKTKVAAYEELASKLLVDTTSKKKGVNEKEAKRIKDAVDALRKGVEVQMKLRDRGASSIGFDAKYDNTYTKTLDQLKNFVLEDDVKYLEAIKRGMLSLALDEIDTKTFVELLISAAEECAYEVSAAIHTNFIDKVSVFKLANQKRLIEIVKKDRMAAEAAAEEERKKAEKELADKEYEERKKFFDEKGPDLYEKVVKSHSGKGDEQVKEYVGLFDSEKEKDENGKEYSKKEILDYYITENWKDCKDEIEDLLKLHLVDVPLNSENYLNYIPIILYLFDFIWYGKSGGGIKSEEKEEKVTPKGIKTVKIKRTFEKSDIKNMVGFSLKPEDLLESEKEEFKELVSNFEDDKFKYSDKKHKLLEEVFDLINDDLINGKDKIDTKSFLEIIDKLCEKDGDEIKDGSIKIKNIQKYLSKLELIEKEYRKREFELEEKDTETKKGE